MNQQPVLILGAGLTGLTTALELSKAGRAPVLLEKEDRPGGLARTFAHDGFKFDIGGHRFFTHDQGLEKYFLDLFGNRLAPVCRRSSIFKDGVLLRYPVSFLDAPRVFRLLGARAVFKVLRERFLAAGPGIAATTFEDWAQDRFGPEIYALFLGPYIAKFWGCAPAGISAAWASQRIAGVTPRAIFKSLFWQGGRPLKSFTRKFFYPENGIGELAERLQERLAGAAEIHCHAEVVGIRHAGRMIAEASTREKRYQAGAFVSTLPLTEFIDRLSPPAPAEVLAARRHLTFRDWIGVHLIMDRETFSRDQWIYFPDAAISFSRLQQGANWSRRLIQPGRGALLLEFLAGPGDRLSGLDDQALIALAVDDFCAKVRLLRPHNILGAKVTRIKNAYPVYKTGFAEHLRTVMGFLGGFKNLYLAGRGGRFKYLNMDHALEMGIKTAGNIQGQDYNLDLINAGEGFLG